MPTNPPSSSADRAAPSIAPAHRSPMAAAVWRPFGFAIFLAAVWVVAALVRPTSTYHLAPILVAGAAPFVAVSSGVPRRQATWLAAVGLALAVIVAGGLALANALDGPSLLPVGGAVFESVVFAVVGAVAGAAYAARS